MMFTIYPALLQQQWQMGEEVKGERENWAVGEAQGPFVPHFLHTGRGINSVFQLKYLIPYECM